MDAYLFSLLIVFGFTLYGFWVGVPKIARGFANLVDRVAEWVTARKKP
jgi:predicted PurR-regulated permease PerM